LGPLEQRVEAVYRPTAAGSQADRSEPRPREALGEMTAQHRPLALHEPPNYEVSTLPLTRSVLSAPVNAP